MFEHLFVFMKVLVLGASLNPGRYSYIAVNDLQRYGHSVTAVGRSGGSIGEVDLLKTPDAGVVYDTITVYLNPVNQSDYMSYLLEHPARRIIFNPGAENFELEKQLKELGWEVLSACTLVMLRTDQF